MVGRWRRTVGISTTEDPGLERFPHIGHLYCTDHYQNTLPLHLIMLGRCNFICSFFASLFILLSYFLKFSSRLPIELLPITHFSHPSFPCSALSISQFPTHIQSFFHGGKRGCISVHSHFSIPGRAYLTALFAY